MDALNQYRGLPTQVYLMCAIRTVAAMGGFVYAFTSLLYSSVLGFSDVATGYMMIITSLSGVAGSLFLGHMGDKYGRRKLLIICFVIEDTVLLVAGFLVYSKWLIVCLFMLSAGYSGLFPVMNAIIADNTDDSNRTESLSLMFLCINLGWALGQTVAGMLFYNYVRWIFWGQGAAFFIVTILIILFLKDNCKSNYISEKRKGSFKEFILSVIQDKSLVIFILVIVFIAFSYSQLSYLQPVEFTAYFGIEVSSKWVSKIWAVNGLCYAFLTPIIISIVKKYHPLISIGIASFLYIIGFGFFIFIKEPSELWMVYLSTIIWTSGEVVIKTEAGVYVASKAPDDYKARYQSIYEVCFGVGRCIGPAVMGTFLNTFSYNEGWILVVAVIVLAAILDFVSYKIGR